MGNFSKKLTIKKGTTATNNKKIIRDKQFDWKRQRNK